MPRMTITITDKNAALFANLFHAADRDLLSIVEDECDPSYYADTQAAGKKATKLHAKVCKAFNLTTGA